MAVYSISDLEKLTGIRAATIRAWEQRYQIVQPKRTKANIRYYLDEDLRELLNIALLNRNGMRISQIAKMRAEERAEKVMAISAVSVSPGDQLDTLTLAAVEMDEFKFSHVIDTNIRQRGFEETMLEVIYPFLDKMGVLYFTGSIKPVQEAFIGNIIRRKLLAATDQLGVIQPTSLPVFGLYLPEGERQELSLLFVDYLLRKRGFPTRYLGCDVSVTDLSNASRRAPLQYLFTIFSNGFVQEPIESHVSGVLKRCPESTLLLSGYQSTLHDYPDSQRVLQVNGLQDMLQFVETLK